MPLLLALVIVVGGGILYGLLSVGHIPIKFILIVFVITFVTAWSILKSLVVRRKDEDPGVRLDLDREPALRALLVDVAGRVGTRPVDSVYMTPGTEVAVFERGGLLRQLGGRTERCLILGAGTLEGMRLASFRAVLAHEYGHFSNRDTAGGGLALAVRMSVVSLATHLAQNNAAGWYNPAWLFVNGFHRLFLRISQGASRLQEVLADRWAAILFGAQAFEDGLKHVIDRSVRFDAHVRATLQEVVDTKRPLKNLYTYTPSAPIDATKLDGDVSQVLEREPSPYDSHPRPVDRFRWVHALGVPARPAADDAAPVWGLFVDRGAIEERMTGLVRANVAASHGVAIPG
jgi:Zn-dependent protease with chaperone function